MPAGEHDVSVEPVERFDPESMYGELIEAEHLARYAWAGGLVQGKRVLDAGCGSGYGSDLLVRAGAAEVVGVDLDAEVVGAARNDYPAVTFATADIRELPAELGDFDVVVCFEVLEHLDDPETALGQLGTVLREGALLVVSSPNRDVYPPGNPFHKHEFRPDELADALGARFAHVQLVRQHDWLASGVFGDEDFASLDAVSTPVAKAAAGEPGSELYTLALAGDSPLPPVLPFVMLTQTADLKWWQELLQTLRDELETMSRYAEELQMRLREREDELRTAYADLEKRQEIIDSIQATRVWRLGTAYWNLRDRLLRRRLG